MNKSDNRKKHPIRYNDYHYNNNNYYNENIRKGGYETYWGKTYVDKNIYNNYDRYNWNPRYNENFRDENFREEFPTPWEGEILRKLRNMIQRETCNWRPEKW